MNALQTGSSMQVTGAVLVVVVVLVVVQLALDVIALVDLVRRPVERVALGNKWVWVAIILLVNVLGAILYLAVGRKPAPVAEVAPGAQFAPRAGSVADSLYGPRSVAPGEGPQQGTGGVGGPAGPVRPVRPGGPGEPGDDVAGAR